MKRLFLLLILTPFALWAQANADVPFSLSGLQEGDKVSVTISSSEYLNSMTITADGDYSFSDVPTGMHAIKVEAIGYNLPDSKLVNVKDDGTIDPFTGIRLVITKMDEDDSVWTHSWHEDGSISGYTTTAYVNKPAEIEYLGKMIVPANVPSQLTLERDFHVILSDEGTMWTQEYAYRLLETMKMFPYEYNGVVGDTIVISLTNSHIADDITIEESNGGKFVTLATEAFAYANPYYVNLDGVRGRFFSKRLHHALVNLWTNYGYDKQMADRILQQRFACSIYPPDYEALTSGTTDEDGSHFQDFNASELVEIINMFEEMPEGFHKIPGLNYLIRRIVGHKHPVYPDAAAVTWAENGYIEFMDAAFDGIFDTHRLMIHEKTHMLWAYTFSEEIKNDWIAVGGWYQDSTIPGGWATTKDTEFVSAYAHAHNPNEDMAESVAFYMKNPDKLMSRSLPKYEFIRDRIMHGTRYISSIREDLTFEVLNLFPDYDYPGKIKGIDIQVLGKPEEDKTIIADVWLNHIEGLQDGASEVYFYLENHPKEFGFRAYPVDGDPYHLRAETYFSKYRKSGYYNCWQINMTDEHGNERLEAANDFVWNMYINNPLEDTTPPVIDGENLRWEVSDQVTDGHQEKVITFYCNIWEENVLDFYDIIGHSLTDPPKHWVPGDGTTYNEETHVLKYVARIPDYLPTADYVVSGIGTRDIAWNEAGYNFYPPTWPTIHIETTHPDNEAPELDLNRITIYAEPVNKEAPDGETLVTISYFLRDNYSGLLNGFITLRDPQGIDHGFWANVGPHGGLRYDPGDPTVWQHFVHKVILPRGSAPGIWGLAYFELQDKAQNVRSYDFVETLIFEPDENIENYILFADMTSEDILNFDLTAISGSGVGYSYVYRIVSEDTGQEISGVIADINHPAAPIRRAPGSSGYDVDVSSLPYGKLVVIIQVKDESGNVVAVRSKSLMRYRHGDLSGDGIVNGVDLVAQTNLIMTDQYDAAADLNNDGEVNGLDYVIMVNLIMSETSAPAMQAPTSNRAALAAGLSIEDFDIKAGETKVMFINLSNPDTELTLLQFDMRLPEGLSIVQEDGDYAIDIAGRTTWKKHSLMAKAIDGTTRFLLASNTNALIDGDNGNVISIKLTASNDFRSGDIKLENQLLVSPNAEKVIPADYIYSVGDATSIDGITAGEPVEVYTLTGSKVRHAATSLDGLPKGVYIIKGKKVIVK